MNGLELFPPCRVARRHAIARLDVMGPPLKTLPGLLLASLIIGGLSVGADPIAAQSPPPPAKAKKPAAKPSQAAAAKQTAAPVAKPAPAAQATASLRPLAEEAEHVARYDAAIAPARDYSISPENAGSLREAIAAAAGGRVGDAKGLRDRISDPAARKLVEWYLYRGGYGSAADVRAFFAGAQPRTAVGFAALAGAYLADKGDPKAREKATALAQKAWIDLDVPASLEPAFLARVGGLLTEADHKRRLDRLLFNDSRWTEERNGRAAVIRRVIALLSEEEKKKAQARL